VTIAIDGASVSQQPPSGSDLFFFACDGEPHDYTLEARSASGASVSETRSVSQTP
jgi:hypothetical protein